jgi:hypothetical protein
MQRQRACDPHHNQRRSPIDDRSLGTIRRRHQLAPLDGHLLHAQPHRVTALPAPALQVQVDRHMITPCRAGRDERRRAGCGWRRTQRIYGDRSRPGLSRRRSRVRVPSLPLKSLQIGILCCPIRHPNQSRPHRLFRTDTRNARKRAETRLRVTVSSRFAASTPLATAGRRHTKWPEVKRAGFGGRWRSRSCVTRACN